jgi:hypothetical protein
LVAAAPSDGLVAAAEALVTATETYLDTQRSPGMWGTDRGRLHQAAQNLRAALATPEPSAEADAALQDALWYRFKAWEERAARNGSGMVGDQMTGASMMLGWLTQEGALRPATPPLTDE